jgi:hypothetical protein
MSKTMQINPPLGFKFQVVDQLSGVISLIEIPKDIKERIKTFDDVCREMGKNPKDYICTSDDPDDIAANALRQSLLISRCFNADKKEIIDWLNSDQRKYFHVYTLSPSSGWSVVVVGGWCSVTRCGSRQAFLDPEHAQYAWDTFKPIYINLIK